VRSAIPVVMAPRKALLHVLDEEVAPPCKQAFRETYVLTPAERRTRDYSNRFAGHVFRQVQARALMNGRGWSPIPLAWWDDRHRPRRRAPPR
jgi:hypothetical protein